MHMQRVVNKKEHIRNYILTFLLIALSGITFFLGDTYLLLSFLFTFCLFILQKKKIDEFIVFYCLVFALVIAGQVIKYQVFPFKTVFGLFLRISFAYFTLRLVGKHFINYYINILYTFSIISFFFYIPIITFSGFENYLVSQIAPYFEFYFYDTSIYKPAPQFIVYTVNTGIGSMFFDFPRNSGPFWEPGGFACFLIIALIFIILQNKTLKNKKGIVIILALLSTFSTGGYIAFAALTGLFYISTKRLRVQVFVIPLLIILSITVYQRFNFLEKKISFQLAVLKSGSYQYKSRSRFISALVDFNDIKNNPVVGRGLSPKTRFDKNTNTRLRHRNNGLTKLAVEFGLIIFILYFSSMFKSFKVLCKEFGINKQFAFYIIIIISMVYFSQSIPMKPLFLSLTFLHLAGFKSIQQNQVIC